MGWMRYSEVSKGLIEILLSNIRDIALVSVKKFSSSNL